MLSVDKTPYVGRFARDWHRLSTTDHPQPFTESTSWSFRTTRLGPGFGEQDEHQSKAEHKARKRHERPSPALRRLNLEPQGAAMMGDEHLARDAGARDAFDVRDHRLRDRVDAKAVLAQGPAERHIFGEHEVALVETSDELESTAPDQKAGTRDPVNRAVRASRAVTLGRGIVGPDRCEDGVQTGEPDVWKNSHRRVH